MTLGDNQADIHVCNYVSPESIQDPIEYMYAKQVLIHHLSCITYTKKRFHFIFTVRFYALQFYTLFVLSCYCNSFRFVFFQFCFYKLRRQFNNNANYGKTDKVEALKLQLKCVYTQGFKPFRACVRNVCVNIRLKQKSQSSAYVIEQWKVTKK